MSYDAAMLRGALNQIAEMNRRQPLVAVSVLFLAGIACGYRLDGWPYAAAGLSASALLVWRLRRRTGAGGAGAKINIDPPQARPPSCEFILETAGEAVLSRPQNGSNTFILVSFGAEGMSALRTVAAAAAVMFGGWVRAGWDLTCRETEAERLGTADVRQTMVCRIGPDVTKEPYRKNVSRFLFRVQQVSLPDLAVGLSRLPVNVVWYGEHAPQPGERWRLRGKIAVRKGRDGLPAATFTGGENASVRISGTVGASWMERIARARRQAVRRVTVGIEDWGYVPVLNQAMLLGCRAEMPPSMRRVFANSGTIHVFAISGLHLAFVAGFLVVLVSMAGVSRPYWGVGVVPLLVFYTVITGARPSAVRACVMAVIYLAAPLFGRRPNALAALAATVLVVYAADPSLIYNIGCTLSFAVMAGLVVFCQPLCAYGRTLCRVDALAVRARLHEAAGNSLQARWLRWSAAGLRFVVDTVAVSLTAWLASLPLTAFFFGRFTPGGFFANLVITPCAFFVMVAGCFGLLASMVSDWAASCFNHAAGFFTVIMVRTAGLTAGVPWANFRIARWEPWMVWCWFAMLVLCAVWLYRRPRPSDGMAWLDG